MRPEIVIGIGSPYGDDQAGWRVAECFRQLPEAAGIEILIRDRPGSWLLEDLEGRTSAILVDAIHSDAPAGTLHCLTIDSLAEVSSTTSSHGFGLAETLSLGKALGLLPSRLLIYGVEIEPGQTTLLEVPLTPAVAGAAQRLAALLAQPDVLEGRSTGTTCMSGYAIKNQETNGGQPCSIRKRPKTFLTGQRDNKP